MVLGDGIERNRGVTLSIESNCVTIYIYYILYPVTRIFQNLQKLFFTCSGPFLAQGAHVFPPRSFRQSTKVSDISKKGAKKEGKE